MVDTSLSSLAHLNTPTLSSVTNLLQVAGSFPRLALDTVPFREVDLSLAQLPISSIGDSFTNINHTLRDIPSGSNATLTPRPLWYSLVNLSIRAGLLFLSYFLFKFAINRISSLSSESDTNYPPATDQRHNSANPPEHKYLTNIALPLPHEPEYYNDPLSFFPASSSPQRLALCPAPPSPSSSFLPRSRSSPTSGTPN